MSIAACAVSFAAALTLALVPAAAGARTPGSGIHLIKHVVIIMQENHSFDNYFGTYPGADGIPGLAGHPGTVPCVPDPNAAAATSRTTTPQLTGAGGPHFQESARRRHRPRQDGRVRRPAPRARRRTPRSSDAWPTPSRRSTASPIGDQLPRRDGLPQRRARSRTTGPTRTTSCSRTTCSSPPRPGAWSPTCTWSPGGRRSAQDANNPFTCMADNRFPEYDRRVSSCRPRPERGARGRLRGGSGLAVPATTQQPPIYALDRHHLPAAQVRRELALLHPAGHRARLRDRRDDLHAGAAGRHRRRRSGTRCPSFSDVRQDNQIGNVVAVHAAVHRRAERDAARGLVGDPERR